MPQPPTEPTPAPEQNQQSSSTSDDTLTPEQAADLLRMEMQNAADVVSNGGALPSALRRKVEGISAQKPRGTDISEEMVSAVKLKELTGLEERKISRLLAGRGVTLHHRHGYELRAALRCIVEDLVERDTDTIKQIDRARLRQAEADAFTSEAKAKIMAGELVPRVDARAVWMDGFSQMRNVIEGAGFIPMAERRKLVDLLLQIKLPTTTPTQIGDVEPEEAPKAKPKPKKKSPARK